MKILIFTLIFLVIIPAGAALLKLLPKLRVWAFAALIASTAFFVLIHIDPEPEWTGSARGYALSLTDIFSSILLLSMAFDPGCKLRLLPRGVWWYFAYCAAVLLSGFNAEFVRMWGFEVVKMFWMYIFFIAAYNYMTHYLDDLWPVLYTVCGILFVMLAVGFYQKYFGGIFQVKSTMPHQNSMTLYVSLAGMLVLGTLLNEKTTAFQMALLEAAFLSAFLLIVFSFSRGGLVIFIASAAVVCLGSVAFAGLSAKKLTFSVIGVIAMFIFLAIAFPRLVNRFVNAPKESASTRINLSLAAVRVANDYVLGAGANNFCTVSGPFKNYAREQYETARIDDDTSPYGGIVETIYLLVAAECGWWGFFCLLGWFGYYYFLALGEVWSFRHGCCFGVALGCFGGLTENFAQSSIEWSLKQYNNFYELMLIFAIVAMMAARRDSIIAAGRESRQLESMTK